jgi:undecaprenyl-diphosphatase
MTQTGAEVGEPPSVKLRYAIFGPLVFFGAAWAFGAISEDLLTGDPLVLVDQRLSDWLHLQASPRMASAMGVVSATASASAVILASALLGCMFVWTRQWRALAGLTLSVGGGMLLNIVLKHSFGRARPGWADAALALGDLGFPSGHVMLATIVYGFILLTLLPHLNSRWWQSLATIAAATLVVLVALSRMALGAHYLSDVLAAMAAGMGWLMLCVTLVEAPPRRPC